ncbi:MAG: NADH-quinone oxidoreductase subunit I [Alistipes sp.]|nr:NADH-quinone oxidoreductase subunit I [Alistipes sp.]
MEQKRGYVGSLVFGIKSLLTGFGVTGREFFKKKVTEEYPDNRDTLQISPRFRGRLTMPDPSKCVACGLCQMNCPNDTISLKTEMIEDAESGKRKKVLISYDYDLGACMFCQLCVNACPHDAIQFSTEFENAVYDRNHLKLTLNKE